MLNNIILNNNVIKYIKNIIYIKYIHKALAFVNGSDDLR